MIQNRIKNLFPYFKSVEIIGGTLIVKVNYEDKWSVFPSSDGMIKVAKSKENKNEWYYYTTYDDNAIDMIFDLIEETIKLNLSALAKLELYNEKVNELKDLFANESLDRLANLQFVIGKKKRNSTTKKDKKTEQMEVEVGVSQNNNENIIKD